GSWDIVFTADDPYSRPDPYRGQLMPYAHTYGLTPLNQDAFNPLAGATGVSLTPLGQGSTIPAPTPATVTPPAPATDYFYAFGSTTNTTSDVNGPSPTSQWTAINAPPATGPGAAGPTTYTTLGFTPQTLIQNFLTTMDPINPTSAAMGTTSPLQI